MLFSTFSFSEVTLSDLGNQTREFWFEISPSVNETWSNIVAPITAATLTLSNPSSSFSEVAFSQSSLSDLGLTNAREAWSRIDPKNLESWTDVSPSGTESWTTISPSGDESWVDISTRII